MEGKKLKVIDANLLYLLGAILFMVIGSWVQYRDLISGLFITQYILILLPPILYLIIKKVNIKKALRLNSLRIKHVLLIGAITILMYPAAVAANAIMMFLLSLLGNLNIPELPTAENVQQYALLMFIISISAGICEEVFFRGFILRGYEPLGKKKAIIISALMFGFFHFNLYNLAGPIVLGLVFAYLVSLTDSIFAGMVGHIVNNGFAVTLGYAMNYFAEKIQLPEATEAAQAAVEISTTVQLLISAGLFAVISLGTGFLALHLVKIIKRDIQKSKTENRTVEQPVSLDGEAAEPMVEQKVQRTGFGEYVPLLLVVPLFLWVATMQIQEIIKLG